MDDEMSGHGGIFCGRKPRAESADRPVLPRPTALAVQGHRVRGSCYPLCKKQLERQISISDVSKQAEKEQVKIMQARRSLSNQIPRQIASETVCRVCLKLPLNRLLLSASAQDQTIYHRETQTFF